MAPTATLDMDIKDVWKSIIWAVIFKTFFFFKALTFELFQ